MLRRHSGHRNRAVFAPDYNNAGVGYVPSARAIGFKIVADLGVLWNAHIFVKDGTSQFGMPPDVAIIHDHTAFHLSARVYAYGTPQNRFPHQSAGENASARDD